MTNFTLWCLSPFFMQQPWVIICCPDRKWLLTTQVTARSSGNHSSLGHSLATNSHLLTQLYTSVPCFGCNLNEEGPFNHLIMKLIIICPSTVSLARKSPCWLSEVIKLFSLDQPSFLEALFLQWAQYSLGFSLHSWPSNCKQVFFFPLTLTWISRYVGELPYIGYVIYLFISRKALNCIYIYLKQAPVKVMKYSRNVCSKFSGLWKMPNHVIFLILTIHNILAPVRDYYRRITSFVLFGF